MHRLGLRLSLIAFSTFVSANLMWASAFNSTMAGFVMNNTFPDTDFDLLTQFVGTFGTPINYSSAITTTGFTTTLFGVYAGQSLNVTYTGSLAAFPGVTWTSSGTYGANTWTGSGSATFSFPTGTTFQINYLSTLSIGSNTGQDSLVITGTDGTSITDTGTSGTVTVNGVAAAADPMYNSLLIPVNPMPGAPDFDDIVRNGKLYIVSNTVIDNVSPGSPAPPSQIVDAGTIQVVPEPASLSLFGAGVLGLLCYRWKCSKWTT